MRDEPVESHIPMSQSDYVAHVRGGEQRCPSCRNETARLKDNGGEPYMVDPVTIEVAMACDICLVTWREEFILVGYDELKNIRKG